MAIIHTCGHSPRLPHFTRLPHAPRGKPAHYLTHVSYIALPATFVGG
jgi:hypothetical protein